MSVRVIMLINTDAVPGGILTWIDFLICGYAIGIHNGLETASELVDLVEGGRSFLRLHSVEDGGYS